MTHLTLLFWVYTKKYKHAYSYTGIYTPVSILTLCTVYNRHTIEQAWVHIKRRIDNLAILHTHNAVIFSYKEE